MCFSCFKLAGRQLDLGHMGVKTSNRSYVNPAKGKVTSFRLENGLWFMSRSSSCLIWGIILRMITIILFCQLIMAISQGLLARWSHLIWLCKDHSTEVVLSFKRGGQHYPNEKQAEKVADLSLWHFFFCSCRSSSRACRGSEKHNATTHLCIEADNTENISPWDGFLSFVWAQQTESTHPLSM